MCADRVGRASRGDRITLGSAWVSEYEIGHQVAPLS